MTSQFARSRLWTMQLLFYRRIKKALLILTRSQPKLCLSAVPIQSAITWHTEWWLHEQITQYYQVDINVLNYSEESTRPWGGQCSNRKVLITYLMDYLHYRVCNNEHLNIDCFHTTENIKMMRIIYGLQCLVLLCSERLGSGHIPQSHTVQVFVWCNLIDKLMDYVSHGIQLYRCRDMQYERQLSTYRPESIQQRKVPKTVEMCNGSLLRTMKINKVLIMLSWTRHGIILYQSMQYYFLSGSFYIGWWHSY